MCAPIWLEFGTRIGGLKANTSINSGRVINGFTHKAKANFCHAYRVNCFKEQSENRYVGRLNITGVPFDGYNLIKLETTEI